MKIRDFGLLTDENLDPAVVLWLRQAGFDVFDVCEQGLQGSSDLALLQLAVTQNRLIVTHDSDFGTLAILQGEPVVGLLYLRPGHIDPQFTV
jgi:predicted nuclease of predicted toxin-antitoxin system